MRRLVDHRVSRRALLTAGAGVAAAAVGTGLGIEQGELPGRPWFQAHLGLNGAAGVVPDVRPGLVTSGSFASERRLGAATGWSIVRPPGEDGPLPVVVALHGYGQDHATLTGPAFRIDRFLAAAIAAGVAPFAIAAVDGGTTYWHPRPSGEDAGAMVVDEFLPLLEERGLPDRPDRAASAGRWAATARSGSAACSAPTAWPRWSPPARRCGRDPRDASEVGFADARGVRAVHRLGHQADLAGIPVRVDCGTGDPFYRAVEAYVDGFPAAADVTAPSSPAPTTRRTGAGCCRTSSRSSAAA